MKTLFAALFCLVLSITLKAQAEETFHQSFETEDASQIYLDLKGEYEMEYWAGNNILIETYITLDKANPSILKHFIKEGRYTITTEREGSVFKLHSKDKKRPAIKFNGLECPEVVKVKMFVPDSYTIVSQTILTRKKEE